VALDEGSLSMQRMLSNDVVPESSGGSHDALDADESRVGRVQCAIGMEASGGGAWRPGSGTFELWTASVTRTPR
jgi:hypothetical protein